MSDIGPTCLSELELDRLLAGDPAPSLRGRLAACDHCRKRLAALERERDERMTPDHVGRQADAIFAALSATPGRAGRRPGRGWRVAAPVGVLAAAAAVALVWSRQPPSPSSDGGGDTIRLRGGVRFEVVLAAPGPPRVLTDDDAVPAGATLSFRAGCPGGCSVALFAVGAGGATPLADASPPPWRIAGAAPELLPVSATLDDAPGDDRLVAFLCREPRDLAALGAAAAAPMPHVPGCEIRTQRVRRSGATR